MSEKIITVKKVSNPADLETVFEIRRKVFVEEQGVSREDEFDEFEEESIHFLAEKEGVPIGAARWRRKAGGVKLERFAVLLEARSGGVGSALVASVLEDVKANASDAELAFLHAQVSAVGLYAKFGFEKEGEMFEECDIQHYKMVKRLK